MGCLFCLVVRLLPSFEFLMLRGGPCWCSSLVISVTAREVVMGVGVPWGQCGGTVLRPTGLCHVYWPRVQGGIGLTALKGESHCCRPDLAVPPVERLCLPVGTGLPRVSRRGTGGPCPELPLPVPPCPSLSLPAPPCPSLSTDAAAAPAGAGGDAHLPGAAGQVRPAGHGQLWVPR